MDLQDFMRAAREIGAHGDNDTLPFDWDTRFIKDCGPQLAEMAAQLYGRLSEMPVKDVKPYLWGAEPFAERLLVATGATGFRTTTKIHPFWNMYLNGLGIGIARAIVPERSDRALSYRFVDDEGATDLFDRTFSWRAFRTTCLDVVEGVDDDYVVVQTDISSFYERISHHHIENMLTQLVDGCVAAQVNALLSRFSAGRSFGLPVGGQFSRVVAEMLMLPVDAALEREGISWFRFVDDYVLIAPSFRAAHEALACLSHELADYGLSLNRTKTTLLKASSFADYVRAQVGVDDDEGSALKEIDLHFDPYSDSPVEEYEDLRATVESLDVQRLLSRELDKSVPDSFLVAQVGRTLGLHAPNITIGLVQSLISEASLRSFRGSWPTIMRGISHVRSMAEYQAIHAQIDRYLDEVAEHSAYLLTNEGSQLHYLRSLRFSGSKIRSAYVWKVYKATSSETVKRACLDCVKGWGGYGDMNTLTNDWVGMHPEVRRMAWLASLSFGEEGRNFRRQRFESLRQNVRVGAGVDDAGEFASMFEGWARGQA